MIKEEKILILGAGGFIGGRTFELFSEKEYNVIGTARGAGFIHLDVLKDDWQTLLLKEQPSVIINALAYGNSHDHEDEDLIKETTLNFPKNLIKFCHENLTLTAFIQLGSSSEYGKNCKGADELFDLYPNSEYSINKGELSKWCHSFTYKYNFPLIYFRLFSIYGPGEADGRLIPTLLRQAKKGTFPTLGDKDISRDFVHVDDVVSAFELAIKKSDKLKGEIINICTGSKTTLKDLAKIVRKEFDITEKPNFGTRKNHKWDLKSWYGNPAKAEKKLGWKAQISLADFFKGMK